MGQLNVLVGANGAGKSNFVEFFRMLAAMFQENLQGFVSQSGGGDGQFYEGPQTTRKIAATLMFGANGFQFQLEPVPGGDLVVGNAYTTFMIPARWHRCAATGRSRTCRS